MNTANELPELVDIGANLAHRSLMLETDAPLLLPWTMPKRPKATETSLPSLPFVLHTVADCLRKEPAEVASATRQTARQFFGLQEKTGG